MVLTLKAIVPFIGLSLIEVISCFYFGVHMALFRKKFTLEQVSHIFVRCVHDDYEEAYPTIIQEIKKIPCSDELLHSLNKNSNKKIIVAKIALEMLMLPKIFKEDIVADFMKHIIYQSANILELNIDYISSSIDNYTEAFKEGMLKSAEMPDIFPNPLEQFTLILYEEMNIMKRNIMDKERPDSFIISLLSKMLVAKHGEYFKNIKKDIKII